MRIAFTATGTNWDSIIDPRFGRTEYIVIYDEKDQVLSAVDNSAVKNEAHDNADYSVINSLLHQQLIKAVLYNNKWYYIRKYCV